MAQHFLLSKAARGKKIVLDIARMSNDEAFNLLCETRWGEDGTQCCPSCGVIKKHYFIKVRKQFRCAEKKCAHTFSVTSGTKFAYHKKSYQDVLYATALFANAVEGTVALRNSTNMGVGYTWDGVKTWMGVTSEKNGLGVICAVSAFFIIWALYNKNEL